MRNRTHTAIRLGAAALGALALTGLAQAGIATADEVDHGDGGVDVTVEIPAIEEPGVLALSVSGTTSALTESGSDALIRQFTGALPTVTVTDTRAADEVPANASWYVLGTASDFVGGAGQDTIGAEYLGWSPRMISDPNQEEVSAGIPVSSILESGPNNVGLVDQELLAFAPDSAAISTTGSWTATADLALQVPATVTPGSYSSTVTLSLFESDE